MNKTRIYLILIGLLILIALSLISFQKNNMNTQTGSSMNPSKPSFPVGEIVTYSGQAINNEYGAVLVYTGSVKDYYLLIEGMNSWPEENLGKDVTVTGTLLESTGNVDYILKNAEIR